MHAPSLGVKPEKAMIILYPFLQEGVVQKIGLLHLPKEGGLPLGRREEVVPRHKPNIVSI